MARALRDEHFAGPERSKYLGGRADESGVSIHVRRLSARLDQVWLEQDGLTCDPGRNDPQLRKPFAQLFFQIGFVRVGSGDEDRRPSGPFVRVVDDLAPEATGTQRAGAE